MYDIAEGVTRQQDLRTQLHSTHAELDWMNVFVHSLRHSSDDEAAMLLTRLRSGEDVAQLADTGAIRSNRYSRLSEIYRRRLLTLVGQN